MVPWHIGCNSRAAMKTTILVLALAACGGHDFDGTWLGSIERDDVATSVKTTVDESWDVDETAGTLDRTRGNEHCTLSIERGTCSHGCYDKVILAGQTCTLDGVPLVLLDGLMETAGGTRDANVSLSWATAPGDPAEVVESGTMIQQ
jgi:hypothetical protein